MKKIGIASDHAGYELKEFLTGYLDALGWDVHDFGCSNPESCDYPDYGHPLAEAIASAQLPLGIGICGTGNGMAITMNRHKGVRAALCWSDEIASLARAHNNANACVLPARYLSNEEAVKIVDTFLKTGFEGGRHERRIEKI